MLIKNQIDEEKKRQRIGLKNKNSRGQEFEIIDYKKATDITVKFFNGEISSGVSFADFKKGTVRLPSEKGERHGERYTKLWKEWNTMLWRCNPKNKRHHVWYSDKGIKVCKEWKKYTSFRNWALSNGFKENLTIDRIDETKDYSPENCRWISLKENVSRIENSKSWISVNKYDLNGNFVENFKTITDATKSINIKNPRAIKDCCEEKRENYKGFIWKYADKNSI